MTADLRALRRRRIHLPRALPWFVALPVAVIGGVVNSLAFPALGWWWLVFLGTPLLLWSVIGRRAGTALLVGVVGGFAFYGTLILWITVYLGPVPWLALAGLEAVFFGLGMLVISLAWRFLSRASSGPIVRLLVLPMVVAGLWTLREYVAGNWPYGGFSWGRLAFAQAESPLGDLVAWTGVSGLSFLLAWVAATVVQTLREGAFAWRPRVAAPAVILIAMVALPSFPIETSGTLRVAAVQGDADAGLYAEYEAGEILQKHLAVTRELSRSDDIDLVVWPENASDLDPLRVSQAASALDRVTEELDAPLVTGTITVDGDDVYNSLLLWNDGESQQQYDKAHPVPFAEYLPDRDFWYPLAPELLSMIPRDYTLGTRSNVFDIEGVKAGLAICFDIVDDGLIREMMAGGSEVILAPSNNADFGRTDESVQQLAIARLRALETGRSVVNISTVGTSAIIDPTGHDLDRLEWFEPGSMVQDVPLSTTTTPATIAGQTVEWAVSALGLLGLLAGAIASRRRR